MFPGFSILAWPELTISLPAEALLANAGGLEVYEHPAHGDEAPLIVKFPGGRVFQTDCYELDELYETLGHVGAA